METITLAKLNARAIKLYEKQATVDYWLTEFKPLELAKLWHEYCVYNEDGQAASYDDEVYDALDVIGYWNMV